MFNNRKRLDLDIIISRRALCGVSAFRRRRRNGRTVKTSVFAFLSSDPRARSGGVAQYTYTF